jgi:hypothetical protein
MLFYHTADVWNLCLFNEFAEFHLDFTLCLNSYILRQRLQLSCRLPYFPPDLSPTFVGTAGPYWRRIYKFMVNKQFSKYF